jgi:hypothetical protein
MKEEEAEFSTMNWQIGNSILCLSQAPLFVKLNTLLSYGVRRNTASYVTAETRIYTLKLTCSIQL